MTELTDRSWRDLIRERITASARLAAVSATGLMTLVSMRRSIASPAGRVGDRSEIRLRSALVVAAEASTALAAQLRVRDEVARRIELLSAIALELNGAETAADVSHILGSTGRTILNALFVNVDLLEAGQRYLTVIHSLTVPATIVERYSTLPLDESTAPGCAVISRPP